jgi:hypothetical protein
LGQIVDGFEALALKVECAIEALVDDDRGTVNLAALHRARDAVRRRAPWHATLTLKSGEHSTNWPGSR